MIIFATRLGTEPVWLIMVATAKVFPSFTSLLIVSKTSRVLKTLLLAHESTPNVWMACQCAEFKPSAPNRMGSEQNHLVQVE
jgi:hypothetical protein